MRNPVSEGHLLTGAPVTRRQGITGPEGPDHDTTIPPGWRHPSLPAPPYGRTGLLALAVALAGLLVANMIPDGSASRRAHAQDCRLIHRVRRERNGPGGRLRRLRPGRGRHRVVPGPVPTGTCSPSTAACWSFREPPDHEDPRSAQGGNVYRVTVEASGGAHDVDVTVTDVDEAGTVKHRQAAAPGRPAPRGQPSGRG